jgi:predicted O-methyltransferase YrrM
MYKWSTIFGTTLQYIPQQESRHGKFDFVHIDATESKSIRWYSLFLMLDIPVLAAILAVLNVLTKYESENLSRSMISIICCMQTGQLI